MNDVEGPVLAEIPRYLTAIAEWGACVVYIAISRRRFGAATTALIAALGLAALLAVQLWAGTLSIGWWIPGMLVAAATMFALIHAGIDATARGSGFIAARAFVLAELAASGLWQIDRFYSQQLDPYLQPVGALVVYGLIFGVVALGEHRQFSRQERFDVGGAQLVGSVAIAVATFGISNLSFVSIDTPFSGRFGAEILYIRTLVDLSGFIALHVQLRVHNEAVARRDAEAMAQLLRSQHDQYEITRRSIDEVNRKHHDMKHHLDAIRSEQDPSTRARSSPTTTSRWCAWRTPSMASCCAMATASSRAARARPRVRAAQHRDGGAGVQRHRVGERRRPVVLAAGAVPAPGNGDHLGIRIADG